MAIISYYTCVSIFFHSYVCLIFQLRVQALNQMQNLYWYKCSVRSKWKQQEIGKITVEIKGNGRKCMLKSLAIVLLGASPSEAILEFYLALPIYGNIFPRKIVSPFYEASLKSECHSLLRDSKLMLASHKRQSNKYNI